MFGLSTWEILIILAVALIFVGPDQLPKVAKQIGKGVRQVRSAMGKVDDEMRRAVREAAAELDDDGEPIKPREVPPAPTIAPPPAGPETPDTPAATPIERDWSQVGRGPVPGRVATTTPGRPISEPTEPPPAAPGTPSAEPATATAAAPVAAPEPAAAAATTPPDPTPPS